MDTLIRSHFDRKWEENLMQVVQAHRSKFGLFDISDIVKSKSEEYGARVSFSSKHKSFVREDKMQLQKDIYQFQLYEHKNYKRAAFVV